MLCFSHGEYLDLFTHLVFCSSQTHTSCKSTLIKHGKFDARPLEFWGGPATAWGPAGFFVFDLETVDRVLRASRRRQCRNKRNGSKSFSLYLLFILFNFKYMLLCFFASFFLPTRVNSIRGPSYLFRWVCANIPVTHTALGLVDSLREDFFSGAMGCREGSNIPCCILSEWQSSLALNLENVTS